MSSAGQALNMGFSDIYFLGISPILPDTVQPFIEAPWYAFWTFTWTLWPHEFGHWARAEQVGSEFIIRGYGFPFPDAEHNAPPGLTGQEESLVSIGGFEVNSLTTRAIHRRLYQDGYAHSDQLVYNFFNQLLFPMYTYLFIPRDPTDPETWLNSAGDPSQFTLITFKNYYGRPAIQGDGSVDPDLIDLYREVGMMSLIWPMLDPTLYTSISAFAYDRKGGKDIVRPWLIGDKQNGWSYSTLFNPSPLGYELYLMNYLIIDSQLYSFYGRKGVPFQSEGVGLEMPGLIEFGFSELGLSFHHWRQDIYGEGSAIGVDLDFHLGQDWTLMARYETKDQGYLLGRRIEASSLMYSGVSVDF